MVTIDYGPEFEKQIKKIKNSADRLKVKKQIIKIIKTPEIGIPMRYSRKGTREVYIAPFRLSYIFYQEDDKVVFLDLYHKDE